MIENVPIVRRQHAQLMILQIDDALGLTDQGAGIAGQEVLAFADAEDQRTAQAGADDQPRMQRTERRPSHRCP